MQSIPNAVLRRRTSLLIDQYEQLVPVVGRGDLITEALNCADGDRVFHDVHHDLGVVDGVPTLIIGAAISLFNDSVDERVPLEPLNGVYF